MEPHERILKREYKKGQYDLRLEQGLCYRCGKICDINLKTKKPYIQCEKHRKYSNKSSSHYKKAIRAAARAGLVKRPNWINRREKRASGGTGNTLET